MPEWIVYSDGASRGNPGPAGYGAVVENRTSGTKATVNGYLGIATNNVAEYRGLLAALDYALAHGGGSVEARADSELMVRQLTGRYQVKNPTLQALHRQVLDRLARFERWTVRHVPREQNREADRLANAAIDAAGSAPTGSR
ncbi:MAG: ribonuclease HI family protein [Actinomycetia bacterium]|nr:ribonuclease HI family protein [Actinomycetes bacterium]